MNRAPDSTNAAQSAETDRRCLIVVPTYNESDNILPLIDRIFEVVPDVHVLVVDDNSPDGTGKLVRERMKNDERVRILERPDKLGLGTAYVAGFKYALAEGYDLIFEMDADFSHDPSALPAFLKAAEEYDVVIGSRYVNGVSVVNWPIRRLILSYAANIYCRLVTGLKLSDITTGYKCFRRNVLEAINLDNIHTDGYAFQIEMNYKARQKGFRIGEVPIIFVDRHAGTSKIARNIVWEAFFIVWLLKLGILRD